MAVFSQEKRHSQKITTSHHQRICSESGPGMNLSSNRLSATLIFCLTLLSPIGPLTAAAQAASSPAQNQAPPQRPTSAPYAGDLSIFEYPDRTKNPHTPPPRRPRDTPPGNPVADIGAGSGWFSVRPARRTGPQGTVF